MAHPFGLSAIGIAGGVLEEVGIAGALLVYRSGGKLVAIDGHLRKGLDPNVDWPCLVLDVDDDEATKLLATHDPIAALAGADADALGKLLAQVETEDEAVQRLLDEVAAEAAPNLIFPEDGSGPPEMELLPHERYDYVLLTFTDSRDFAKATSVLGLDHGRDPRSGWAQHVGLVRVIDGPSVIKRLMTHEGDHTK